MVSHEGLPQSPPPPEDAELARLRAQQEAARRTYQDKDGEYRNRWGQYEEFSTMSPGDLGISLEEQAEWNEAKHERQRLWNEYQIATDALDVYETTSAADEVRPSQEPPDKAAEASQTIIPAATEPETPHQTDESSQSAAEKERRILTLGEVKNILISQLEDHATINNLEITGHGDELELHAELDAGLLGGMISIRGAIVNRDNEIAIGSLGVDARGYVKSRIENNLSRFFPTIKTHLENRYRKPISSIQIANDGIEITFEESPSPSTAEPNAEGATHAEPTVMLLRPESDEMEEAIYPELAEFQRDLAAAREEYARLAVAGEKQSKNRPRERRDANEGEPRTRMNLLREDITPIEGLAEAEKTYRAALAAIRAHGGQILRENTAGLPPRKLQKEIKNQFREATLYEADRLYSEKIDAELAEKPRIRGIVGEVAQGYREMSTWWKMTASGTIFFGTAAEDILLLLKRDSPLLTSTEEPTELQNTIMGILVAKAGQSMTKGYQKTKARRETRRAMTREAKMQNGDLLAALLATDNERLNDLTLTQAARKSDEKTKRRVAAAVGAAVGYITSKFLLG